MLSGDGPKFKFSLSADAIALICAIVLQFLGGVWWASGITQRVDTLEKVTAPLADHSIENALSRIEQQQVDNAELITSRLDDQRRKLDQLTNNILNSKR